MRLFRTWTNRQLLAGVVLLVAGVIVLVITPRQTIGYFAYFPSSHTAMLPTAHTWQERTGEVLVLVGAVATAFALGRISVRRR
jgi:hypothetical protein